MIENQEQLNEVLSCLKDEATEVAFDIETTGVQEHVVETIGIAFTWFTDGGIYLPLYVYNKEEDKLKPYFDLKVQEEMIHKLCETLLDYKLIMHNGVFDIACIFHRYAINLTAALWADTILMKHTVDEERPFGLKQIGEKLFGEEATDEQKDLEESVKANGGRWNKKNKDMYKGDLDLLAKYAIKDVILTLKIYDEYSIEMEQQGLDKFFYKQEVMPLYKSATIPMKLNGMYIDIAYFNNLKKEVEDGIIKLTDEVFDMIEDDIEPKVREILDKSIRSSRTGKFAEGLLRHYELPVPLNKKTGKPTLAKSALRSLEVEFPEHPAITWLMWEAPKKLVTVEKEIETPIYAAGDDPEFDKARDYIKEIVTVEKLIKDESVEGPSLPDDVIYAVKKELYVERYPAYPRVFNLSSTHHLSWLLFDVYGQKATKHSKKTGQPTVDKDALDQFDLPFIPLLAKLKKEEKLLSTYIGPILEKQHNGWLYPSMQQFGTTSGRYSCGGGLNFQTLPRDDKRVKKGFIAPPGYKVVAADFSSLEPRIFSWVSDDPGLKAVYWDNLDLYSQIAIDVFGLEGVSAHEEDDNFLKKVQPSMRQLSKVFTLAVPYGAGAGRIANILNKDYNEADNIIKAYLNAYPGLKTYMTTQEKNAFKTGMVYTRFGRIRHLPHAKELYDKYGQCLFNKKRLTVALMKEGFDHEEAKDESNELFYKFRNYLNNAKNFPIQSTAAHVTNAALIYLAELLEDNNIDGWICLQVHDEIILLVKEEQAEFAGELVKEAMENNWVAREIDIPMIAVPEIGNNFAEAK